MGCVPLCEDTTGRSFSICYVANNVAVSTIESIMLCDSNSCTGNVVGGRY